MKHNPFCPECDKEEMNRIGYLHKEQKRPEHTEDEDDDE
jgi:hypothetical protein